MPAEFRCQHTTTAQLGLLTAEQIPLLGCYGQWGTPAGLSAKLLKFIIDPGFLLQCLAHSLSVSSIWWDTRQLSEPLHVCTTICKVRQQCLNQMCAAISLSRRALLCCIACSLAGIMKSFRIAEISKLFKGHLIQPPIPNMPNYFRLLRICPATSCTPLNMEPLWTTCSWLGSLSWYKKNSLYLIWISHIPACVHSFSAYQIAVDSSISL